MLHRQLLCLYAKNALLIFPFRGWIANQLSLTPPGVFCWVTLEWVGKVF
jgi:hypothetical protein